MHVCVQVASVVSDSTAPWTATCQAPLSMNSSRQEYWRGLPFPTPGDLPDPGIEPMSPASPSLAGRFFTTEPAGKLTSSRGEYLYKLLGLLIHGQCMC